MPMTYPGTTIETSRIEKGASKVLFDGIFSAGGITLSQVCVMTGLEPYMVQNWIKRGFLTSPAKRMYSREQFARIIIINMLRETLQIDRICGLLRVIGGELENPEDDLIGDEELYHRYVDMISDGDINMIEEARLLKAAEDATESFTEPEPNTRDKLKRVLLVMFYAHAASRLCLSAQDVLSTLD